MASTPVHKPLQSIDGNAMTPTQWLQTAKYVQYTSPAPLTPYKTAAHSTPDSHTRRMDALQANIDRSMVALMAPHPQRTPPPPPAPPPPPPSAIRAVLPPAVDSSSDDDVPLAAMMLERDAERAAEKEDVKSVEDIKSVSAPVPADPVPPTLSGASDAPPLTLALRLKHKYNKAKEVLELGAHGGMKMVGRHPHGCRHRRPTVDIDGHSCAAITRPINVLPAVPSLQTFQFTWKRAISSQTRTRLVRSSQELDASGTGSSVGCTRARWKSSNNTM